MIRLQGIDHVALAVRDVPRSVAWYCDVLGLERRHEDVWGDVPAFVGIGTTALALFPVRGPEPKAPHGSDTIAMRHLAFRANRAGFDKAQEELRRRSIPFTFEDHTIAHSIYFDDPDGHHLEITTYDV
jgi:catechol 2,3-dioxygenase-like lactoylglutathione lyase family enzyme